MNNVQYQLSVVLEIPNVQIYELRDSKQKLVVKGNLQIIEIEQLNICFLKLDSFQYTFQKNIPVMTQTKNQANQTVKVYVFPCVDQTYFGIMIDQNLSDIVNVFEIILSNRCHFVQPLDEQNQPKQQKQGNLQLSNKQIVDITDSNFMLSSRIQQVNVQQQYGAWGNVAAGQPIVTDTAQNISKFIIKGSELFKDGVIYGANILSQGVQYGGQYITSKIKPDEKPAEVSDGTLMKVKIASTGSKGMLIYTQAQIDALVKMGKMVGEEAGKQFGQSETGVKIQSYEHYSDAKTIGKATVYAAVNVYDGLIQALFQLGKTCAETTTNLINYKYGQQAGELSKESFEVAGNVGQLTQIYKIAAAQALLTEVKPQEQIHIPSQNQQHQQPGWQ